MLHITQTTGENIVNGLNINDDIKINDAAKHIDILYAKI